MDAMRTLRVTGKGTLKIKPDLTRLTITLQGNYKDYTETLEHSAKDTELLQDTLAPLGFAREDLKTLSFDVDTRYEGYQDKSGNYRQRFVGYEFTHVLKLEFPSDNALLGKTLYALAHSAVKTEFRISYTVRDTEAAKNKLLGAAVTDARAKAEVLSKAAGVFLKEIRNIDYSWGTINFEVQPVNRMLMADAGAAPTAMKRYDMEIEPDDIVVSDTVTVVWEIA